MQLRSLLLVALLALVPTSRAESWFQEARRIRKDADALGPRSRSFKIHPAFTFTDTAITAGATFKDHGQRVIARQARVQVELPIARSSSGFIYQHRHRILAYNGEPAWTGRDRRPWAFGFFEYTVFADYRGNTYTRRFRIGRKGLLSTPSA